MFPIREQEVPRGAEIPMMTHNPDAKPMGEPRRQEVGSWEEGCVHPAKLWDSHGAWCVISSLGLLDTHAIASYPMK